MVLPAHAESCVTPDVAFKLNDELSTTRYNESLALPHALVAVTTYQPVLAGVVLAIEGFWITELNAPGPLHDQLFTLLPLP